MGYLKLRQFALLVVAVALTGCAGSNSVAPLGRKGEATKPTARAAPAPARSARATSPSGYRKGQHRVVRGDTLYSIAWRYGHDFREVAAWNNIGAPFTIYPGQVLALSGPSLARLNPTREAPEPVPPPTTNRSRPSAPKALPARKPKAANAAQRIRKPVNKPASKPKSSPAQPAAQQGRNVSVKGWAWPTNGKVIRGFKGSERKGVDFGGREGQPITAAAQATLFTVVVDFGAMGSLLS